MEKSNVVLDIAGLLIGFDTRFPEYIRERCGKYLATERRLARAGGDILHLEATEEDVRKANVNNVGEMEAECYAMTIPLSEQCPALGRMMTHGVAIECDGKGFIFTAGSGVGKSTHAFLWQKYLGEDRVRIVNGDKPILWFRPDGEILACGSPWSGKECLDENVQVPLRGICLLTRLELSGADAPFATRATREEALDFLLHQIFIPRDPQRKILTLRLLEALYEKVPVYNLYITKSPECVRVSSECLLNTSTI